MSETSSTSTPVEQSSTLCAIETLQSLDTTVCVSKKPTITFYIDGMLSGSGDVDRACRVLLKGFGDMIVQGLGPITVKVVYSHARRSIGVKFDNISPMAFGRLLTGMQDHWITYLANIREDFVSE